MRRHGTGPALLAAAALAVALPAVRVEALAGVGRAAVEAANGSVPESVEALEERIRELEATETRGGTPDPDRSYCLAILRLNRPKSYTLDDQRKVLAQAIAVDPGFKDALSIWLDLVPNEVELKEMDEQLGRHAPGAAVAWARANVAHRQARYDDANRGAEEAERLDPAYRGRARWLRAQVAGERKDDVAATRLLEEALGSLDDALETLLWDNALLVATPDEIERHKTALEERSEFFRAFWKRRDVFPLTETNERLGEHFRRLATARLEYGLRSNGYGYYTTHDAFKQQSPDLSFYSSDVVYDYQERIALWLDHRGLVFVRHGEPDRSTHSTQTVRSETWLYSRFSTRPLLFHFIERRAVGEFVLTLNLAQAMATSNVEDNPEHLLSNTGDFRDLYGGRAPFHQLFQRVAISRSSYEVQDLLDQEAAMMAGFIREVWVDDTNSLIKADDLLPFAFHNANFRGKQDTVDAYFYYAIPERELKPDAKGKVPSGDKLTFDATIVLYDDKWTKRVASGEDHLTASRTPAGRKPGKKDFLRGKLVLPDLAPGRYNYAFQVTERSTGKIGIAKGRFVADYFGPEFVEMSDLLLAVEPQAVPAGPERSDAVYATFERGDTRLTPEPTRMLERGRLGKIYFELYDLTPGADGQSHYRVEYRVLQIQQKPSVIEQILGFSMNIAGAFFPYEIFLARAGLFGLDVATSNPTKGLAVEVQERQAPVSDAPVTEVYRIVDQKYPPGIYQVYVTVKDYVSGSVTTRSVRFAVD